MVSMTMVEIDIGARSDEIISVLARYTPDFSPIVITFDSRIDSAAELLSATRRKVPGEWKKIRIVCLVDQAEDETEQNRTFYQEMNSLRESWVDLNCHLIFFLLPAAYRLLVREADHLADWIPLKLHITGDLIRTDQKRTEEQVSDMLFPTYGLYPKAAARQRPILEKQLRQALASDLDIQTLTTRYYLPMFIAAVQADEINRAQSLRKKISASDIARRNLEIWFFYNFQLDFKSRLYEESDKWLDKLSDVYRERGDEQALGSMLYHNKGVIAQKQRDFAAAETWYKKSLAIMEKQGTEAGAASTYHQLGMIAQKRRDFEAAKKWYKKSLTIEEKQDNEYGASSTYHQLGIIAQEQRDFPTAEKWYNKSLMIWKKQGDEHGASISYHQLGIVAQERRNFTAAEKWYKRSLAISEKQGNEHSAASTYNQPGIMAQEQGDFPTAEKWCNKSLAIKEKQGNEHDVASTYHQLGVIAQEQQKFAEAKKWHNKSLVIKEKHGNKHGAAVTYNQLGHLAHVQQNYATAAEWYLKAISIFLQYRDSRKSTVVAINYSRAVLAADPETQAILRNKWKVAGFDKAASPDELFHLTDND